MPHTLTMPKLSPTMENGTIVHWMKKEGDEIKSGDVLFEVATDKATVEYNALDDGFLRKILVQEGGEASVNEAVAITTDSKDESIEGYAVEGQSSESIQKEEEAPMDTKEKTDQKKPKSKKAESIISEPTFSPAPALDDYQYEWPTEANPRVSASPLAKKLAAEKGIDLSSIKGSGPGGRVVKKDLDLSIPDQQVSFHHKTPPATAPGSFEEENISPMRKAIGDKLQASKSFIPHFYVQKTVCVDSLVQLREQLKATGVKVTFNDFVLRACAIALKEHPVINSGYDSSKKKIVRFKTVDIAVAVSLEDGLITPIIRHADYKNLGQLSSEVRYLATKAKEGQLDPKEYTGGSFTISNLGMYGIDDFRAVINPPQVSILAVGGILDKPIVKNGQVVPGKLMTLSLSSDHRVVDGADAAKFLNTVQSYLENPASLIV